LKEAKTVRLLLPFIQPHGWILLATILLGIVSSLAEGVGLSLFIPLLQSLDPRAYSPVEANALAGVFRKLQQHFPAGNRLPYIVGLILAMTICKGILTFAHSALASGINARVTHALRSRIFSTLLAIPQQTLDETGSGRLINLLATDTWHTSDAISLFIGLVINLCSIFVFSALLVALSWKLTSIVVLGVAAVSLLLQTVTRSVRRWGQEGVDANAVLSGHMLDALEGSREIQMFGLGRHLQTLFDAVSARVRSIYFRLDLLQRAVSPLSEILYVSLLLGLLLIGVAGLGSIPTVIVFLIVLYRLQPQIRQFDSGRLSLVALTSSVKAVNQMLRTEVVATATVAQAGNTGVRSAIEFDHVSFSYGSDRETVLRDVSLCIPAGKTTAIVGQSGSGKTTLISLLCRFYEPSSGRIRVDGLPLSALDADDWRRRIAWVGQDAHLFSASIRENIRYGRLEATDSEILTAAIEADADGFIRLLPEGYDTKIGNGETQLSSGQTQRIALARAFVRKPAILLLDEATNALDSVSEEWIRSCLRAMAGRCTVIVISHRLSTVYHADQVIVLSEGGVSEIGAPQDLATQRGLFSRLRELQHVG